MCLGQAIASLSILLVQVVGMMVTCSIILPMILILYTETIGDSRVGLYTRGEGGETA